MAKKSNNILWYVLHLIAGAALSAVLITVRYVCMDNKENSFVDSYCMDDNYMRTVLSFILTAYVYVIALSFANTTDSVKTMLLTKGINEGTFVAITSSIGYKIRSLRTRWAYIVFLFMAVELLPGVVQPLSNAAVKTVNIYVKNKSSFVYAAGPYNVTKEYCNNTLLDNCMTDSLLSYALDTMVTVRTYSTGSNSKLNGSSVTTRIVRSGFAKSTEIIDGDSTNSVTVDDVVATVTSACEALAVETYDDSAQANIKGLNRNLTSTAAVAITNLNGERGSLFYTFASSANVTSATHTDFVSSSSFTVCAGCDINDLVFGNLDRLRSDCRTSIDYNYAKILYTVGTHNVEILNNIGTDTNIDVDVFAKLVFNRVYSPEETVYSLADVQYSYKNQNISEYDSDLQPSYLNVLATNIHLQQTRFEPGLFNDTRSNFIHSKFSSAVANTLQELWIANYDRANPSATPIPVYNLVTQAYFPVGSAWAFTTVLFLSLLVLCQAGIVITLLCPINIKDSNELALLYNIDHKTISDLALLRISNNPDMQSKIAFDKKRTLYCREEHVYDNGRIVGTRLKIGYDNTAPEPDRYKDYM